MEMGGGNEGHARAWVGVRSRMALRDVSNERWLVLDHMSRYALPGGGSGVARWYPPGRESICFASFLWHRANYPRTSELVQKQQFQMQYAPAFLALSGNQ